ncbi:PGDYG protein [Pararobbsia alpina]|uniref:PGDYG domain-containing protein n=1 Tax=Pararobbsia alpina TaxID=621374 RepID=UPI0039A63D69
MLALKNIDLRNDPAAHEYVKDEVVDVAFARADGEVMSREGPNHFRTGDAVITGSTGDRWSVTRDRFDPKYDPVEQVKAGEDGPYRAKRIPVLAKQIHEPFTIERVAGGDLLTGVAGDWVMQYAPGDYGLVERARFERVYRLNAASGS